MQRNRRLHNRMSLNAAVILLMISLVGCDQNNIEKAQKVAKVESIEKIENQKWLNPNIKQQFETLGQKYGDTRLKRYSPVMLKSGDERYLQNCSEIDATQINDVIEREASLLILAKLDCAIGKQFLGAESATSSYLPKHLTKDYLLEFPARIIPSFNDQQDQNKQLKTVAEIGLSRINRIDEYQFEVLLNDTLAVKIIEVARADFNADGVEDLMIMIEWQLTDSWDGEGVELLIVQDSGSEKKLVWRFNATLEERAYE